MSSGDAIRRAGNLADRTCRVAMTMAGDKPPPTKHFFKVSNNWKFTVGSSLDAKEGQYWMQFNRYFAKHEDSCHR
jgi:hypothetical protein